MTKRIIFIFAALCSLQARASVRPAQADTVRYTSFTDAAEPAPAGAAHPSRRRDSSDARKRQLVCRYRRRLDRLSRYAARLRGPVRTHRNIVQPRRRQVVHALGRRTDQLQRIALQGRPVVHTEVPLCPCGSAVECSRPRVCPAGAGALGLVPLRASACCIMLRTGTTRLRSPTAYRGSTASPEG